MKTRLLIIISLGIFGFFALSFLLSPSIFGEPYCTDGRFNTDCKSWNNWEWVYYNLSGYRDYPPPLNLSEINLQRILDTCKAKENFVSDKGSNVEIDVIFREYSNNTLYINNADCFWEDLTTEVSSGNVTFNDPVYPVPDGTILLNHTGYQYFVYCYL